MRLHLTALLCAALLCTPSIAAAFATYTAEEQAAKDSLIAGAISTGLSTTGGVSSSLWDAIAPAFGQLDRYIRDNAVALQQDLQVGGGQTVDDLAQLFGVPVVQRPVFARLLRAHSAQLIPLTTIPREDPARTRRFILIIAAAMSHDPTMALGVERLLEAAQQAVK
jgi:hypothetical protein